MARFTRKDLEKQFQDLAESYGLKVFQTAERSETGVVIEPFYRLHFSNGVVNMVSTQPGTGTIRPIFGSYVSVKEMSARLDGFSAGASWYKHEKGGRVSHMFM